MHEILSALPHGSRVLDLGSGPGSFDNDKFQLNTIRADIAPAANPGGRYVICSASRLPFADRSFQALILNHSLEHFEDLTASISEITRVLARDGFLYIAVPDASTLTDHIYRWLARGGGHINLFSDIDVVPRLVVAATGLKHAGTRTLGTSLSFLNRNNITSRPPRKLLLFCSGREGFLRFLTFFFRFVDRIFQSRTSIYGWAFYFGNLPTPDSLVWSNVCVRCGSGSPSSLLEQSGLVRRRRFLPDIYFCPQCRTRNFFTDDGCVRYREAKQTSGA